MKHKAITFMVISIVVMSFIDCMKKDNFPVREGPYLGQTPPGMTPEIFAPGIIKNCPSFTPDGNELVFRGHGMGGILFMQCTNGNWTDPKNIPFSGERHSDFNPFLSSDGTRCFFASDRPISRYDSRDTDVDIFIVEKFKDGWGKPRSLGDHVNSDKTDGCPTATAEGTVYFFSNREGENDIYISRFVDGQWKKSENLGFPLSTDLDECDPFISLDERYIIICISGRKDGFGENDLYLSFRMNEENWTEPLNMGNKINSPAKELFPRVSPDGKYLFFTSNKGGRYDTYWVDAKVIEELKPDPPK